MRSLVIYYSKTVNSQVADKGRGLGVLLQPHAAAKTKLNHSPIRISYSRENPSVTLNHADSFVRV